MAVMVGGITVVAMGAAGVRGAEEEEEEEEEGAAETAAAAADDCMVVPALDIAITAQGNSDSGHCEWTCCVSEQE